MSYKVKIYGAGSIGNHLANASRHLGWDVDICDVDADALTRTKDEIYPSRYGQWDEGINLYTNDDAPKGGYDLICIGTPPDSHISLAMAALEENPRAIQIEKPLCGPDMTGAQAFLDQAKDQGVMVFIGYDHVVGEAAAFARDKIKGLKDISTIDVEFREYWGGIFAAHPWLDGPHDTYLGFWKRGGGAAGEHSHAINLWQDFALAAGVGRVVEVNAMVDYVSDDKVDYDRLALLNLKTESGLIGRVVQDVVTQPPRKWARIQAAGEYVEWHCGYEPNRDAVKWSGDDTREQMFSKTRPDDFIREMKEIEAAMEGGMDGAAQSSLAIERGLDTMMVVAAVHKSHETKRTVRIDYSKGYIPEALSLV